MSDNTNNLTSTREVDTKAKAQDKTATRTVVTFDWTGVTQDQYRAMAESWATIKLQIGWRKNGIPATAKVKVLDIVPGTRQPRGPVDPLALFLQMSPEEQAAFLAKAKESVKGAK